ncbi:hypothetical protein F9L00_24835 [Brucella anthropi]|uniref:hypothetical protein n=1 Tax=Brucella anthropi TaxID=529 RepID=UPI00124EDFD7|nr:hypothetical protein [Brucella anthropi]KAB2773244.1 hypothetical protein F9L00_24835 [Brucella anthropi]
MTAIFYSASSKGFYSSDVHPQLPSDAVEISHDEYQALLDGQTSGAQIRADDSGKPYIYQVAVEVPLSAVKDALKAQIDALAETERLKYITPGNGQAMTYQQKVAEAQAFKTATNPKATDYPILSSEVGITAETLAEVADIVLAAFAQWQQIGAAIEAIRLGAKRDIDAAEDETSARAIVEAIVWPSAQVQA